MFVAQVVEWSVMALADVGVAFSTSVAVQRDVNFVLTIERPRLQLDLVGRSRCSWRQRKSVRRFFAE